MGQDRPRVPVLDDEDRQRGVTTVRRQEALVHGDFGDRVVAWESACIRGIRHTPANAVSTPRPKRD
eukprot:3469006-Alexandrium_andersonii.AAC.1